jgi:TRAP-type C4-dicarboxylate transport system substrate-binding protein
VATGLERLTPTLERNVADGFIAVPSGALAWQWTSLVRYYSDLPTAMLPACLIITNAALDQLGVAEQQAVRAAGAKLRARWNDATASLEGALLGGLFEKQGLKRIAATPQFRAQFYAAAKSARERLGEQLVPRELTTSVEKMLGEYRSAARH